MQTGFCVPPDDVLKNENVLQAENKKTNQSKKTHLGGTVRLEEKEKILIDEGPKLASCDSASRSLCNILMGTNQQKEREEKALPPSCPSLLNTFLGISSNINLRTGQ
eukprot:5913405-Ditylum_brightwellii.AAC.1